ncbi:Hypothetical predicted protein [Podarcis lilfordi]|uniref:Uncharacterized protein n=1 Tax=Podarcis lilfordi TaxID=74358 RepID=A0AA35PQN9_9SAUR|nr:Hypothetical predicted protein [Podarcis lilfordi]
MHRRGLRMQRVVNVHPAWITFATRASLEFPWKMDFISSQYSESDIKVVTREAESVHCLLPFHKLLAALIEGRPPCWLSICQACCVCTLVYFMHLVWIDLLSSQSSCHNKPVGFVIELSLSEFQSVSPHQKRFILKANKHPPHPKATFRVSKL